VTDLLWRPERGVRHVVTYGTDVSRALDSSEQRIAWRGVPRQSIVCRYRFDTDAQVQQFREDILQSANGSWRIPQWWDPSALTSEVSAAGQTWPLTMTYVNLAVGDYVYVTRKDRTVTDTLLIDQVNANDIHTTAGASGTYPVGSEVFFLPTVNLRPGGVRMTRDRAGHEVASVTADYTTPAALIGTGGASTTYQPQADAAAKQLMPDAPLSKAPVAYAMESGMQRIDAGHLFSQFTAWPEARMQERRTYRLADVAALRQWELFCTNVAGMREPFYTPSFRDDLTLTSQPTVGASVIRVNINPPDYENKWWPYRYENLRLATDAGDIYREVTSIAAAAGDTIDLTLDSALPATTAGSTINQISFLEHVRFAADVVTFEHDGIRSKVNVSVRTAPDAKDNP